MPSDAMPAAAPVLEPDDQALGGAMPDFYDPAPVNVLDRWSAMADWADHRLDVGLDSCCKVTSGRIATQTFAQDRAGRPLGTAAEPALNFASQEYLSLASDPRVVGAAVAAAQRLGVHSAGSAALMGLSEPVVTLERRLADWLGLADCTVFSTGWGAGYGAIRTLMRPGDHLLLDVLSHACLQEAASVCGASVHRFPHCSTEAVARRLVRIRAEHPRAGIMVVTEGAFSMDADTPDIAALQALCRAHGATLFVDVAHDLGALGPGGGGAIAAQGMTGKVDIVMGSFSKTFASNGGFVASNHPALKLALRYACGPSTFTNALSPVQAAAVLACLDIVRSPEGDTRRAALMRNALHLRGAMADLGFQVLGQPCAIVPVVLGDSARSRVLTRETLARGALVNLVENPAVARNACRWRLQVMADHTPEQIDRFAAIVEAARNAANQAPCLRRERTMPTMS